jgi:hypothetical protein
VRLRATRNRRNRAREGIHGELDEIEAIKRLKYRYFRSLDCKQWAELGETLSDDATTAYDQGKYSFSGREAILGFLKDALGSPRVVSLHQGHHPEIELTSATTARGTWYLEDMVFFRDANTVLHGAGLLQRRVREGERELEDQAHGVRADVRADRDARGADPDAHALRPRRIGRVP